MKRFLIAFLFFPCWLTAQEMDNMSFSECLRLARANHPLQTDSQRIANISALKLLNTNTLWYPQLNVNGQATYQSDAISITLPVKPAKTLETSKDQYKLSLDINQTLYDGGAIGAQKQLVQASADADMEQHETELHKTSEQVAQVYFNALLIQATISQLRVLHSTLDERRKTVESAFKNGLLQESDVLNITIETVKNNQQITDYELLYHCNLKVLEILVGKKVSDTLKLELPELAVADTQMLRRPELALLDVQKSSLQYSEAITAAQAKPKLFAFSQAGYGRPGLNMLQNNFQPYFIVGLSLKWNIWDYNKTSRERQLINIQRDNTDSRKRMLERNFHIQAISAQGRIEQLQQSLATDSAIVGMRATITAKSKSKLDNGVITATDYINDLNAEVQARLQFEMHKIQLVQEKANVLFIKGIL